MEKYLEAKDSGQSVFVDPNSCKLNKAGTNMTVEVYFEKDLDIGNSRPTVINFKMIEYTPEDRKKMEEIFNLKKIEMKNRKKECSLVKKQQRHQLMPRF